MLRDPFDDLPSVLSQPDSDRGWVRTAEARWPELQIALQIRKDSLDHLIAEVVNFGRLVDLLQPYMEGNDMTVAEAIAVARRGVK